MPILTRQDFWLTTLITIAVVPVLFYVKNLSAVSLMIDTSEDKAQRSFFQTATDNHGPFSNIVDLIPEKKHNNTVGVCVAVRTYPEQSSALTTMLLSLREAASKVEPGKMSMFVYVVDTEGHQEHDTFVSDSIHVARMVHAVEQSKHGAESSHDVFFSQSLKDFNHTCTKDYGYQATQQIIDFLVNIESCDWIVTTNGDNLFGPLFFKHTGVYQEESASIVGVDFVTHHLRPARDGEKHKNQHIEVKMELAYVDLSSVLIRRKILADCSSARFFPSCEEVHHNQDWRVFEKLIADCNAQVRLVPEILLLHN